jgi:GntR family transcriptional regulator
VKTNNAQGDISGVAQVMSAVKLDKNVPIPLYYQLKKQVISFIESGVLKEGDLLPPENTLSDLLDVSRNTIRQAFGELVGEGYLNRYKGKGSFVNKPKVEVYFSTKLQTFNEEMDSKGYAHYTRVLDLRKLSGPGEANERLGISLDAPLIYLSRLRFAEGVPIIYVETFLPFEGYEKLMDVNFNDNSLYDTLEKICEIKISKVRREIEAASAHKKDAELLQITRNKPICFVKTLAYSNDIPVEFSIGRYRGDFNKFSVDIFR